MKIPLAIPSSEANVIKCKHCGSTQVRPSQKSAGHSAQTTYRCQSCKRHFRVGSSGLNMRWLIAGAALLALVLSFIAASLLTDNVADVEYEPETASNNPGVLTKLQQDAKHGNAQAQYDLGRAHWQNAEYQLAFPWLKAAAAQTHAEAEYLLGMAYLNGRGTLQNYRAALEYFTKSAQQSHLEAEYQLGLLYRDGLATPPNKEAAYLWLNIAASRGHEDALLYRDKLAAAMSVAELHRAQEASTQTDAKLSEALTAKP